MDGGKKARKKGKEYLAALKINRDFFLTLILTGLSVFINFTPHVVIQQKKSDSMETQISKGADVLITKKAF